MTEEVHCALYMSLSNNPGLSMRSTGFIRGIQMVGSLKMNTALEYSTRVVQEGDRRCKKSTVLLTI